MKKEIHRAAKPAVTPSPVQMVSFAALFFLEIAMKKIIVVAFALSAIALSACGQQDGQRKLSPEELARASANAKQHFTQKHKGLHEGQAWEVQGVFTSCNGVDSNANGLTSCFGKLPDATGQNLVNQQIYCGYDGSIDSCQPNDLK